MESEDAVGGDGVGGVAEVDVGSSRRSGSEGQSYESEG